MQATQWLCGGVIHTALAARLNCSWSHLLPVPEALLCIWPWRVTSMVVCAAPALALLGAVTTLATTCTDRRDKETCCSSPAGIYTLICCSILPIRHAASASALYEHLMSATTKDEKRAYIPVTYTHILNPHYQQTV